MPSPITTRRPRTTAGQARFGRGPARPPGRSRAGAGPAPGRFGRGGAPAPGRFARPSQRPAGRPTIVTRGRRRQQKPGGLKGLLASVPGVGGGTKRKGRSSSGGMKGLLAAMPGAAGGAKRRRSSSGGGRRKAGGAALLAGVTGLALKNRDKVSSLLGGRSHDDDTSHGAMPTAAGGAETTGSPASSDVTPADVTSPQPSPAAGAADEPPPASRRDTPAS
jgi:hypothetical protein